MRRMDSQPARPRSEPLPLDESRDARPDYNVTGCVVRRPSSTCSRRCIAEQLLRCSDIQSGRPASSRQEPSTESLSRRRIDHGFGRNCDSPPQVRSLTERWLNPLRRRKHSSSDSLM
jgi:hypothetical protein